MSTADIALLVLLGFGAVKGYLQGFIVELFSFLAFFIGLFLALELTVPVSVNLLGDSDYFEFGAILVFIALFILLSMLIKLGAKGLKKAVDITVFGTLDNMVGAIAGLFKIAFIVSIVFWIFESVGFEFVNEYVDESTIFPYIVGIGPKVFGWLADALPFIEDLIDSMDKMSDAKNSYMTFMDN